MVIRILDCDGARVSLHTLVFTRDCGVSTGCSDMVVMVVEVKFLLGIIKPMLSGSKELYEDIYI